jgi:phage terminase small subunit
VALAPKQARFVDEYPIDVNAKAAAIRAGYSPKTAQEQGSRLLSNVKIRQAIDERILARSKRTEITADTVLRELLRLARVDIGEAFKPDGSLKSIHDMPEDVRRAIAGVEVDELFHGHGQDREQIGYTRKVKFWDKTRALELLGRHLKLFVDKIEVEGRVTLEDLVLGTKKEPTP